MAEVTSFSELHISHMEGLHELGCEYWVLVLNNSKFINDADTDVSGDAIVTAQLLPLRPLW